MTSEDDAEDVRNPSRSYGDLLKRSFDSLKDRLKESINCNSPSGANYIEYGRGNLVEAN